MFKKKPNIKPLAPLRSSERRRIADQIIKDYDIEVPKHEEAKNTKEDSSGEKKEKQPAPPLSNLRNFLLPENALSARFTTTSGPDLKQVSGTIYAGAHPDDKQRVLWYKFEERLIPTVYTLWRNPHLVPILHTQDSVVQRLQSGSPLMVPGLADGPPFPSKARKDAVAAIASIDKPTVPVVVGICEIDVASLESVQGLKGHAVRSEHWEGDELWAWSTSGQSGLPAPSHIEGWQKSPQIDLARSIEKLQVEVDDEQGGVPLPAEPRVGASNDHVQGEDITSEKEVEEELSTREIDGAFWQAFLYGIHDAKNKHRDGPRHGLSFPIPQSLIISNLVLPYLPIHSPSQAAALNIKKTSWKNAKKFIKALDKAKLLKSKDRDGGECVVLDIDFNDENVLNFKPYKLPKKATPGGDSGSNGGGKAISSHAASANPSMGQRLHILTLYRPKQSLSPIFCAANASIHEYYLPPELRAIVAAYIESEDLVSETNKRLVKLDPILANAVFDGRTSLDREVVAKGTVPRDALIDRVRETCSQHYIILRNDETRETAKPKGGKPPKVQIVLETRTGNKTVTKVSGVEEFYVSPHLLADELQKSCASSTSVGQLVGSSPKHPVMEVLVQGPQKDSVTRALEKRGLNKQWIEVVDRTKGKKKG